jgi:uncharacterized protein
LTNRAFVVYNIVCDIKKVKVNMVIQLREVFDIPGESVDFDYEITSQETDYIKDVQFDHPIAVKGSIRNRSGMITMSYNVSFKMEQYCDRCLKQLSNEYKFDFTHNLVKSLANDEDEVYDTYIVAEKDHIDLNDTVLSDILLALPSKVLCREDCKGLCFVCGCNLNEMECNCQK